MNNLVYVIRLDGKGGLVKYTPERYKKFEKSILKSGYRLATKAELEAKGFEVTELIEEAPKETSKVKKEESQKVKTEIDPDKAG